MTSTRSYRAKLTHCASPILDSYFLLRYYRGVYRDQGAGLFMKQDQENNSRGTILVCEDDRTYRAIVVHALEEEDHVVLEANDGREAMQILATQEVDAVVTDVQMPNIDGLAVLRAASARTPPIPVLVMTGFATIESTVEAMKLGALDYLTKPVDLHDLQIGVHQAMERRRMLRAADDGDEEGFGGLLGTSPLMQQLFEQIRRVAPFKSNVLIIGESGTGKELVSRAIHVLSPYRSGPFIAINCSALPRDLIESQLFGHEKGAFTGATARHQGFFEAANGGTLFLDEISELPLESQAKLLRVLESRRVMRLGSTSPVEVNVRLLAATNANLQQTVDDDRFREDLYYRLNVLRIALPILRERSEDIPLLARIFLDRFAKDNDVSPRPINPQVIEKMQAYHWPGNVRELKNMCERLAVMAREDIIQLADLPAEFNAHTATAPLPTANLDALSGMTLELIEKTVITRTLEQTNGNRTRAAKTLGISLRTLQRKIKEYNSEDE